MALGKRKVFNTPHRKRRIFWHRVVVGSTSVIMLASVCALVFYGTRLSMFTVDDVVVHGLDTIPENDVRSRADSLLAGTYYGLVPHRFIPAVPAEKIKDSIERLSRVASATVSTEGTRVVVSVTEHTPEMLWCGSASSSMCYYVDISGVAYERAPDLVGSALLRFIVHDHEPQQGASLLAPHTRALLVDMSRMLEERHQFRVARIEYVDNGDAILYLSQGGRLLMTTTKDLTETYETLTSILSTEQYANLQPGKFEYIDVRFGNKVFVQKEKPVATTTAATTTTVE
jgi:cell division septal protein FtsQ